MKRLISLIILLPALAMAGPYDIVATQRNALDTGLAPARLVTAPTGGANAVMGYNGTTNLPIHWLVGGGLGISSGSLVALPQAWASITGKPTFATVATTGAYADLSGIPSTFSPSAHTQAWSTITATPTTLGGYGITDGVTTSTLASYATTASVTAGLATKFNAPSGTAAQYVRGDGALATLPAAGTGTVTSITAGTGLSGGTITTSGTISLPSTGTAGTYSLVTTDAQGRVTAGQVVSINDSPGRTLATTTTSTGFQVSATRVSKVCYEGSFSTTSTIGGPSSASVFIETADTNSTAAGDWTIKAQQTYTNTITLAIVLNQVQGNNWSMCRYIPAGKYVRIRSGSITGTASATINTTQQETLL